MGKKYGTLIICASILVLCFVGTASAMTWSVDDNSRAEFTGIQDAINNAKDGDTIIVYSGIYYENVVVDKSVTLKGIGHPVVDAGGRESAITLTADGITLVGFNATHSGSSAKEAGIRVSSNNNTITGNNASNNHDGIRLGGSNNNTITGNNVSNNNFDGISLSSSSNNNTITGNNVSNNNYHGISLDDSSNNTVTGNNVCNNNRCGIDLYDSSNNNIYPNNFINNTDNVCSYEPTPKPTPTPTPPSTTTNLPPPVIMPIGSWENPQVEIKNHAHLSITVTFTGPSSATIYLPPGATKTHQFSPGKYSIYATAPGVIPLSGSESLSQGYKYTWIFYISEVP